MCDDPIPFPALQDESPDIRHLSRTMARLSFRGPSSGSPSPFLSPPTTDSPW